MILAYPAESAAVHSLFKTNKSFVNLYTFWWYIGRLGNCSSIFLHQNGVESAKVSGMTILSNV